MRRKWWPLCTIRGIVRRPRVRHLRWLALFRPGILPRRLAGEQARRHPVTAARSGRSRRADRPSGSGSSRQGNHPPRSQAGQRPARCGRRSPGDRLRPGKTHGGNQRFDTNRSRHGHAELHGSRAGAGKEGGAGRRRVFVGSDPLRVPDRPASLQGGEHSRNALAGDLQTTRLRCRSS